MFPILFHIFAYFCILLHSFTQFFIHLHTFAHYILLLHSFAYFCILVHILLHTYCTQITSRLLDRTVTSVMSNTSLLNTTSVKKLQRILYVFHPIFTPSSSKYKQISCEENFPTNKIIHYTSQILLRLVKKIIKKICLRTCQLPTPNVSSTTSYMM